MCIILQSWVIFSGLPVCLVVSLVKSVILVYTFGANVCQFLNSQTIGVITFNSFYTLIKHVLFPLLLTSEMCFHFMNISTAQYLS